MIYVASDYVGEIGGGAKAPLLLCERLRAMGHDITLFVSTPPTPETRKRLFGQDIKIVTPIVDVGSRWKVQQRILAVQLYCYSQVERPTVLCIVSLWTLAKYILKYPPRTRVYVWETTEALPHIKSVDLAISKYLRKTAALLVPSKTIGTNVRATYQYGGEIRILPFWVEEPTAVSANQQRTNNFLFVGRFDRDKGLDVLYRAFCSLLKEHRAATLTLCGDGDARWVTELVAAHPSISLRRATSAPELEKLFRACDAVILPSLHEGYPLCLLEACGRFRPVISSSVGSVPEVYGNRLCALLVPPGDSQALADAMETLLHEPRSAYVARCLDAHDLFRLVNSPSAIKAQLAGALGLRSATTTGI